MATQVGSSSPPNDIQSIETVETHDSNGQGESSPSVDSDTIMVKCGPLEGVFSLDKYVASGSSGKLAKRVKPISSQEWVTPSEFESLGGKKAKKWRESISVSSKGCNIGTHLRSISSASSPVVKSRENSPCPASVTSSFIVDPVLSFIKAFRLRDDKAKLKCS